MNPTELVRSNARHKFMKSGFLLGPKLSARSSFPLHIAQRKGEVLIGLPKVKNLRGKRHWKEGSEEAYP